MQEECGYNIYVDEGRAKAVVSPTDHRTIENGLLTVCI